MIIREHEDNIIMIEQHHHAQISEDIIQHWKHIFLAEDRQAKSVLYAIENHDIGWKLFDKQPFYNDETRLPYDFIHFPVFAKIVLYTYGIDLVQEVDSYAAALCSAHYLKFMESNTQVEVKQFIKKEQKRVRRLLAEDPHYSSEYFQKHLALLQFADNISLYLCLHEPGVLKKDEHFFFKKGIAISPHIPDVEYSHVQTTWQDENTLYLHGLPKTEDFHVSLKQKIIPKRMIEQKGLLHSYETIPYEHTTITCCVT